MPIKTKELIKRIPQTAGFFSFREKMSNCRNFFKYLHCFLGLFNENNLLFYALCGIITKYRYAEFVLHRRTDAEDKLLK